MGSLRFSMPLEEGEPKAKLVNKCLHGSRTCIGFCSLLGSQHLLHPVLCSLNVPHILCLLGGRDDSGKLEGDLALQRNLDGVSPAHVVRGFAVRADELTFRHLGETWVRRVCDRHSMIIHNLRMEGASCSGQCTTCLPGT